MRLIDADALIEEVQDWVDPCVLTFINNAPTVESKKPQGAWVYRQEWFEGEKEQRMAWGCNQCGFSIKSDHEKRNFCPNCGADMREGEEKK